MGNQVDLDMPSEEQMIKKNVYVITSVATSTIPPPKITWRCRSPNSRRSKTNTIPKNVFNLLPMSNQLAKMGRRYQCSYLD